MCPHTLLLQMQGRATKSRYVCVLIYAYWYIYMCVLIWLYMCPHMAIYVSSLQLLRQLQAGFFFLGTADNVMCAVHPHFFFPGYWYIYVCILIFLGGDWHAKSMLGLRSVYMCPPTIMRAYVSSYYYTAVYVSSYGYMCVLMHYWATLLNAYANAIYAYYCITVCMCPRTAIYVCSYTTGWDATLVRL
jgi:hypothetical protein